MKERVKKKPKMKGKWVTKEGEGTNRKKKGRKDKRKNFR